MKVIGRAGTGLDNIDLNAVEQKGIELISTPTGNTISAAEFTIALIIALTKQIFQANNAVRNHDYRRDLFWGREISQLTIGIVGYGNVGHEVAKRLDAFGCRLLAYDPHIKHLEAFKALGGSYVSTLDELLEQSDVVTLHLSLNDRSQGFIGIDEIKKMKPGAILINTARGRVVNEHEVAQALQLKQLAAYGTDVLYPEPPFVEDAQHVYRHPLLDCENAFITPHIAALTYDAQKRIADVIVDKFHEYFSTVDVVA